MTEIVICDDDHRDLEYLENLLMEIHSSGRTDFHIRAFTSATEMLEAVGKVNIVILDISMEEMNGIELGEKVKSRYPETDIIYITSYEQYCMQAINKVHAYSFLCKPVKKTDLEQQILELLKKRTQIMERMEKAFEKIMDSKGKEYPSRRLVLKDIIYFFIGNFVL